MLALQNKAIDAAFTTEPNATEAETRGAAVRFMGDDVIYPNHQVAVILYSGTFLKKNPEAGKRFMRAYIKALRDYNDALKDGKLAGPKADEVIAILTEYTNIKDPAVYRSITAHGSNPDGFVNIPTLGIDLEFFKATGDIEGKVTIDQVVDNSFAEAVVKELGPYKPMAAK